jgi:RNA methyltransferase, TrmH family
VITSRGNARVKRWAKLVRDGVLRRQERRALVEGPHLVAEMFLAGVRPEALLVSESGLRRDEIRQLVGKQEPVVLSDAVFRAVADADAPPGIAAEIAIPQPSSPRAGHVVFLEGVQDPSNVGAVVRTAAAFGVGEVVLDRACADAWSPKALRAAMGGHFKLALRSVSALEAELEAFPGAVICTVLTDGLPLRQAPLEGRLGWVFGSEGHGISPRLVERAAIHISIPLSKGSESLNVAAAAAICLYEAFNRPARISRPGARS